MLRRYLSPETARAMAVEIANATFAARRQALDDLGVAAPGLAARCRSRQSHFSTFTTRARISPAMTSAMADCSIIVIFAHLLVGIVSVGLNAVALVNAR